MLAKAERAGMIAPGKATGFLTVLGSLATTIDHQGTDLVLTDAYALATSYRLTGYDAVYLELARRRNPPLATLDADLPRACRAAGGTVL